MNERFKTIPIFSTVIVQFTLQPQEDIQRVEGGKTEKTAT